MTRFEKLVKIQEVFALHMDEFRQKEPTLHQMKDILQKNLPFKVTLDQIKALKKAYGMKWDCRALNVAPGKLRKAVEWLILHHHYNGTYVPADVLSICKESLL